MAKVALLLLSLLAVPFPSALPGRSADCPAESRIQRCELLRLRKILRPFGLLQTAERTSLRGSAVHTVYRCRVLGGDGGGERNLLVKFLDADAPTVRKHFPHLEEIRQLAMGLQLRPGDGVEVPLRGDFCPCQFGGRCAYLVVEDFGDRTALRSVLRSSHIDLSRRTRALAVLGSALAHFHFGNASLVSVPSPLYPQAPRHGDLNFNNFAFSRDRRSVFFIDTIGLQIGPCGEDIADVVYYTCRDFVIGSLGRGEGEGPASFADCKRLVSAFTDGYEQQAAALLPERILQRADVHRFVAHHVGTGLAKLANRMERTPNELSGPMDEDAGRQFLAGYGDWLVELEAAEEEPSGH